ncbi:MAG TPA: VWA domain-containing protein [Deinococcales bacterium]|nr:VWA domain-containing protein [Deinococcales bacterium]
MIKVSLTPHRGYLRAASGGNAENQKLFLLARLRPEVQARAPLNLVFVVDTSGSMRERVAGGKSKTDVVAEALQAVMSIPELGPQDRVSLVQFDDKAKTLVPPTTDRQAFLNGVSQLRRFSGGTMMGLGMMEALSNLGAGDVVQRVFLLTDGATFDEDACRGVATTLAGRGVPVTCLGVGNEFNEDLLSDIADRTSGKVIHVVAQNANPPASVEAANLPGVLSVEFRNAAFETITNLELTFRGVKGVVLEHATRVYPALAEAVVNPFAGGGTARLGNLQANDETMFLLDVGIPSRPASRVRVAQVGFTFDVPGENRRGEVGPFDVVEEFTDDEALASQINQEVLGYVQQRNVSNLVKTATSQAASNPEEAKKTIALARAMTVRLGNSAMTVALDRAEDELNRGQGISAGTAKTIKLGSKSQTVKLGSSGPELSEEEIRRQTGA